MHQNGYRPESYGIYTGRIQRFAQTYCFFKRENLAILSFGLGILVYFSKNSPTDFIGWIHLLPVQDKIQAVEIGWRLKYLTCGNGYATEAAREIITYAFKIADFNQIVAYTHSDNKRSKEVMKRLGFRYISDFIYNGKIPSSSYEISKKEYY